MTFTIREYAYGGLTDRILKPADVRNNNILLMYGHSGWTIQDGTLPVYLAEQEICDNNKQVIPFWYNHSNGKIAWFGKEKNTPQEIKDKFTQGFYFMSLDMQNQIQGISKLSIGKQTSGFARFVLKESAEDYNEKMQWFDEHQHKNEIAITLL